MNKKDFISFLFVLSLFLVLDSAKAADWQFNNILAAQYTAYTEAPRFQNQHGSSPSISIEPEIYSSWDDGYQSFTFKAFYRYDHRDKQRTHGDIRELAWLRVRDSWELQLGISSVYWGVTESLHLVDIINQSDVMENPDGTVKLGQAMLRMAIFKDWGTTSLFILPGFRERDFPGEDGRFRGPIVINSKTLYQSSAKQKHTDFALRWEHSIDNIDIGLAYFNGTDRNPSIQAVVNKDLLQVELFAYYDQMQQLSLDVQLTEGAWLWKLEAIDKNRKTLTSYVAAVGGIEYTLYAINQSDIDLGLLLEYQYNNLDNENSYPGDNDVFTGLRLSFNDEQSSDLLIGLVVDAANHGQIYSIKGSRRIGNDLKLSIEGRVFHKIPVLDPLNGLINDDFLRVELEWFYSK